MFLGIPYEEVVNPATGETRIVKAETPPLLWFWNSVKISAIASFGILLLSGTAAYAFARLHFKFRSTTLSSLLILQMFPMVLALAAIYVILDFLGQYIPVLGLNTHPGLILVYLGGISGYIWMLKGYFDTIPVSMEESATIDGATQFQTFTQILLPMSAADLRGCVYPVFHRLHVRVSRGVDCPADSRKLDIGSRGQFILGRTPKALGSLRCVSRFERRAHYGRVHGVSEVCRKRSYLRRRQGVADELLEARAFGRAA